MASKRTVVKRGNGSNSVIAPVGARFGSTDDINRENYNDGENRRL
jgi:hypothetical protein